MGDNYIPGDYYILCQATGFKIRRSEAVKQYDGAWVHKDFVDAAHPLDYPREPTKARPVYPTVPEPTDNFIEDTDTFYS